MAITFTAALVRPCDGYPLHVRRAAAGATITPGTPIALNSSGAAVLADGDDVSLAQARGVALSDGSGSTSFASGTRIDYVTHGPVSGFAGMTPGQPVYISPTDGTYSHAASETSGDFNYVIGYAEAADVLFVNPQINVPVAVAGG